MGNILPPVSEIPWRLIVATPIFFTLFIGLVWWVYRKDRKSIYETTSRLPLDD